METDLLPFVANGGMLLGAAVLLRRLLIAFIALTATWSRKAYRRRSALQVLRILSRRLEAAPRDSAKSPGT